MKVGDNYAEDYAGKYSLQSFLLHCSQTICSVKNIYEISFYNWSWKSLGLELRLLKWARTVYDSLVVAYNWPKPESFIEIQLNSLKWSKKNPQINGKASFYLYTQVQNTWRS